jgi:hypothetical protein
MMPMVGNYIRDIRVVGDGNHFYKGKYKELLYEIQNIIESVLGPKL